MDFCEPYDLTSHLTANFYTNLHSAKWSERKDAIQDLITIMETNPLLVPNEQELQKLISDLSKMLSNDNNINVTAASATCLGKLARGSAEIFKHNAPSVILYCLTRMKDTKPVIKNACTECLDSAYLTTTFASVLDPIKSGLAITAPGSKIQSCEFFTRIMLQIDFPTAKESAASTKEVVDQLCKLALGSDVNCREAAIRSLAAFMRAVTKQMATPLLSTVAEDKLKMAKIEENYDQFIVEHPFDDGTKKKAVETTTTQNAEEKPASNGHTESAAMDPRLFATPYNLAKHLNKDFYINFQSQKWSERKDAIQELINIMEKNPVLVPNEQELQKLINDLSKLLSSDSNINVAAVAATCLGKIAYGSAEIFKHNAPSVILLCLTRMKDTKPVIKNACIECIDSAYATTSYSNVIEQIKAGLAIAAPGSKIQSCEFFTRIMLKLDLSTAKRSSTGTKEIADLLCKIALGADVACREAAIRSLAALMRALSKRIALPMMTSVAEDKLKMAKVEENYNNFIAEHPFEEGTPDPAGHTMAHKPSSHASTSTREVAKQPVKATPRVQSSSATPRKPTVRAVSAKPIASHPATPKETVKQPVRVPLKPAVRTVSSAKLTTKPAVQPVNIKPAVRSISSAKLSTRSTMYQTNTRPSVHQVNFPKAIKPNIVSTPKPTQPASRNGDPKVYDLVRPTAESSNENDPSQRRSMLRPPSSVVRPTKSTDNLANIR